MISKGRRDLSKAWSPLDDVEKHAIPAFAPELATQAWLSLVDIDKLIGNSPRVSAGLPTIVSFVGSAESIVNMVIVLEPGFTAIKFWKRN